MKNIQNIGLIILSIAVLFLLYKQLFNNGVGGDLAEGKPLVTEKKITLVPDSTNSFGAVAFVNTDSLLEKFESFKKMRTGLEKRSTQAENELGGRIRALEMEYMDVQKKIQAGTMTETLIKDAEQTLMRKQQELAQIREQKTGQLMEEEKNLTKKLNDQIFDYMQEYAPSHGLKYVLGYTRGGGILYAADSLDITDAVLQGLNLKYQGK
jgi:outer membrane protein